MILVVIWYDYHTSVFAVYDGMHASIVETATYTTVIQLAALAVHVYLAL